MNPSTWTPDNWIAFTAICASVLVSVAGFLFSFFTNRANVKARRAEIAVENSIEAFREVIEKLHQLLLAVQSGETDEKILSLSNEYFLVYLKYRLYFPYAIAKNAVVIGTQLGQLPNDRDVREWNDAVKRVENLIEQMQKYIGLENEEVP